MHTLGYRNRSENAMTSESFQCFDDNNSWDLVTGKLKHLGGLKDLPESSTKGQIFAHPWRDYLHHEALEAKKNNKFSSLKKAHLQIKQNADSRIVEIYEQEFSDLQDKVFEFKGFDLKYLKRSKSYNLKENSRQLCTNVYNTELDVLIADDYNVYVGEAKGEMRSNASATERMLVHQLVRGYVVVKTWIEYRGLKRPDGNAMSVVPFIVAKDEDFASLMGNNQVQFMIKRRWLKAEHVLDWGKIKELRTAPRNPSPQQLLANLKTSGLPIDEEHAALDLVYTRKQKDVDEG